MIFDLTLLKNKMEDRVLIDRDYKFDESLLSGTDLIELLDVHIEGFIKCDVLEGYELNVDVSGIMILPCSITLQPVNVPFKINIEGNLEELLEEIEENHKKIENSIDLLPIIWENILMEIPMKVTSSNVEPIKTEGEGWRFVTDEEKKEINPALAKLKDLL